MAMLSRKLWRDVWHFRGQMFAVSLMMAAGIALFVSLRSMHRFLLDAQTTYYHDYRFADVFATLKRAPNSLATRLAEIPGVAEVGTRIVTEVVLLVPGSSDFATGRLVSIPDRPGPMLNGLLLVQGAYPDPARGEVVVSAAFARAHRLAVGDTLGAVINGRSERLTIAALGKSPEFLYEIRGIGNPFPDARRYGVIWVPRRSLAAAFDLTGGFNDVVLTLARGASVDSVIGAVDRILDPVGGLGAYPRKDQLSNRFVSSEIAETQVTSILIPSIFLGVTCFMLYLVTSRLVATEREQIALLKAFGFSPRRVITHYAEFTLIPVAVGTVIGMAFGLWFAGVLARMYVRFYQFPSSEFHAEPTLIVATIAIAGGAALLGGLASIRAAIRLPPAEAMREPAPPRFRPLRIERLELFGRLPGSLRIIIRNIGRRPVKSALSSIGIAAGCAILIAGWYAFDAIDLLRTVAFFEVERSQLAIGFKEALPANVGWSIARIPGVERVELERAVPVRLRAGHRSESVGLVGVAPTAELFRLIEPPNRVIPVPPDGLVLTSSLADRLGVRPGQSVEAEVRIGERRTITLPVAATVNELLGWTAYVDRDALSRLLGERDLATGARLTLRADRAAAAAEALRRLPAVAGVTARAATLESFTQTIAESFRISVVSLFGFAGLIAAAVVYNSGRIALSERARELASLRVLGFTREEVATMLLGEQAILTAAALPVGALIGYALCYLMTIRFATSLFRFPLVVNPKTYLMAMGLILLTSVATGFLIRRRIFRLDLVAVLKARE